MLTFIEFRTMVADGVPLASAATDGPDPINGADAGTKRSNSNPYPGGNGLYTLVYLLNTVTRATSRFLAVFDVANCVISSPSCQISQRGPEHWKSIPTTKNRQATATCLCHLYKVFRAFGASKAS